MRQPKTKIRARFGLRAELFQSGKIAQACPWGPKVHYRQNKKTQQWTPKVQHMEAKILM